MGQIEVGAKGNWTLSPAPPPNPGQAAAGVGQRGRPGARPGPGLGAIDQHGGQQLGQIIGRGGRRRGPWGGAPAGFPKADSWDMAGFYPLKPDPRTVQGSLILSPILNI